MRVLGMTEDEYLDAFERRNLLTASKWSAPAARKAANALLDDARPGDALVLLGARVSAAFQVDFRSHIFQPQMKHFGAFGGAMFLELFVLVLPHPSGLSREWNKPMTAACVRSAFQRLREHVARGALSPE